MSSVTLSVILYAAIHSGQSCEKVFEETARTANPGTVLKAEEPYLQELAIAACQTNNPDIIWQIVQQESNFRFLIVRQNAGKRVYRGEEALQYLDRLAKGEADTNVDVGVMQLNWTYHRAGFNNSPKQMLLPAEQVDYLLDTFGDFIVRRCSERWIGCYHNPSNQRSAKRYEKLVQKRGKLLAAETIDFLEETRLSMSAEQKADLPPIRREEILEVLNQTRERPLPEKEFFSLAHFLQMGPVKIAYKQSYLSS